jgi:hypothetical protein
MRKKVIILLAVCIIACVIVSLFTWDLVEPLQNKDKSSQLSVVRNFNNSDEERALTTAESVDYTTITQKSRFVPNAPEYYEQSEILPFSYFIYTNVIDKGVIDYYQTRYNYQQKQTDSPKVITLDYRANVTKLAQVRIFTEEHTDYDCIYRTIAFYDIGKSTPVPTDSIEPSLTQVYYKNQSEYQRLQPEFDLTLSDCYVIEMKLFYHEYDNPDPLSGFCTGVHQIIILDQNLVPIWIGIHVSPSY